MKNHRMFHILVGLVILSFFVVTSGFAEEVKKDTSKGLPAEDEFVPVEQSPELIKEAKPVYPKEAMEKKITGKVFIQALIDKNGDPVKVKVAKSSGNELLDNSALEAAKKNKYKPAIQNGQPAAVWVTYRVDFKPDAEKKAEKKKE
jgi:TonB family protein